MEYIVIELDEKGWEPLTSFGPFASRDEAMKFSRSINAPTAITELVPTSVRWSPEEGKYVRM